MMVQIVPKVIRVVLEKTRPTGSLSVLQNLDCKSNITFDVAKELKNVKT